MAFTRPALSLRLRIFILTAVALAPALLILGYNEVSLRRSREAEIHALALRFGQQASLEMQGIISGAEGLLRAIARVPAVRSFDPEACCVPVNVMSWMAPSTSVRRAKLGMLKNRRGATHHARDCHHRP
jgi:hypothetical protein